MMTDWTHNSREMLVGTTRCHSIGFTLIEMLAVVVVLGLVAALLIGAAPSLSERHRSMIAEETVHEALASARLNAGTHQGCELVCDGQLLSITKDESTLATWSLPGGWRAELVEAPHQSDVSRLGFHSDGTSSDAVMHLFNDRHTIEITFLGLSGQVIPTSEIVQ